MTINKGLKVGKHNAMSGHTERGRERERERDFEAIESQQALRRLYTRHKRYQQIHRCHFHFRSSISEPVDGAAVCVCVRVCVRVRA